MKDEILNSALRKLQNAEVVAESDDPYDIQIHEEAKAIMTYIRELQDLAWKYQSLCK